MIHRVSGTDLFDVISWAYGRTSVIVTTNPPFEQWTEGFHPRPLREAALGRDIAEPDPSHDAKHAPEREITFEDAGHLAFVRRCILLNTHAKGLSFH